jgi:hypothetical protein
MRTITVTLLAAGLMAAPLAAKKPPIRLSPDPSAIVAAELAFNRLAREKGQWTAFRETAAPDAVMFMPQKVLAKDWLKKRADPPKAVAWQPQKIWVSCDGRTAASTGTWQRPDGGQGYFTTIWKLDDKGRWFWALDHGDARAPIAKTKASAEDEDDSGVEGKVAVCKRANTQKAGTQDASAALARAPRGGRKEDAGDGPRTDESLLWDYDVKPDNSREVRVRVWNGSAYDLVIDDKVTASN